MNQNPTYQVQIIPNESLSEKEARKIRIVHPDFLRLCEKYRLNPQSALILDKIVFSMYGAYQQCLVANTTFAKEFGISKNQASKIVKTLAKKKLINIYMSDDPVLKGNNTVAISLLKQKGVNYRGVPLQKQNIKIEGKYKTKRVIYASAEVKASTDSKFTDYKYKNRMGFETPELPAGSCYIRNDIFRSTKLFTATGDIIQNTSRSKTLLINTVMRCGGSIHLSNKELAREVICSESSLRRLLKECEEQRLLDITYHLDYKSSPRSNIQSRIISLAKTENIPLEKTFLRTPDGEIICKESENERYQFFKEKLFFKKQDFSDISGVKHNEIIGLSDKSGVSSNENESHKQGDYKDFYPDYKDLEGAKCDYQTYTIKHTYTKRETYKTSVEVGSLLQESSRQGESCNGNYIDNLFTNPLSPWKVTNKIVPPRAQRKSENKCLTKVIKIDYNKKMKSRKNKSNTRTSKPAVQTGGGNVEQILTTGMDTIQKRGADVISLREAKREKKRIEISTRTDETKTKTKTKIENRRGVGLCEAGLMQGMLSQYDNTDVKPPHIARWSIKQKAKAKNIIKHFPDTGDMASFFEFCGSRWQKVFSDKIEWFNNGVVPNTSIDILATLAIADIFMVEWQASLLTQTEQIDKQLHTRKQKQATYPDNALTTDNKSETNTNTAETSKKRLERKLELWEEMNTFDMVEYLELRANSIQYYHPKIFHLISNFNNALGRRLLKVYIQKFKEQTGQQPKFSKFSPQATCKHHIAFVKGELSDEQSIKLGFL